MTYARMTAFKAILGSSGRLRLPLRTETYTNDRDTTARFVPSGLFWKRKRLMLGAYRLFVSTCISLPWSGVAVRHGTA